MKRFLVFAYDNYYPGGGWNDFQKSFDTLEEAESYAKSIKSTSGYEIGRFDHTDVIDLETEDS